MYCCAPDIDRCFKTVFRFFFPRTSARSYVVLSILLLFVIVTFSFNRYREGKFAEAPFCPNPFPPYVVAPARFGPPSSALSSLSRIESTPQNTSGLWVLYNYLSPESRPKHNFVTLTTHITTDFLSPELTDLLGHWPDSPLSVSLTPSNDLCGTLAIVSYLWTCRSDLKNLVSLHLLLKNRTIAEFLQERPLLRVNCDLPLTKPSSSEQGENNSHPYWINAARNVARKAVSTRFIFASDVELYPSPKLVENFKRFIETSPALNSTKTVYVVPAFEVATSVRDRLPKSHRDLIQLYNSNKSVYFHAKTCKQCQKFPRLKDWIKKKIEPGPDGYDTAVQPLFTVKREEPYHRWEPIYIGTNDEPWYDERLSWEGFQDKMTQMHELCLMSYNLAILDTAFLIHKPGIKEPPKPGQRNPELWRKPFIQKNIEVYEEIMSEMRAKYNENKKCKEHN